MSKIYRLPLDDLPSNKASVLITLGNSGSRGMALSIDRSEERESKREELAKLKRTALAELESRGYEVRGKTPSQIREMLKRRPKRSRAR